MTAIRSRCFGGLVLGVSLLRSASGECCQCVEPQPHLVWPTPLVAAPPDTPVVIDSNAGAYLPLNLQYAVTTEAGAPVDVDVVRSLRVTDLCAGETTFLKPRTSLTPGVTYRVTFAFSERPSTTWTDEFVVVDGAPPLATPRVNVEYVRSLAPGDAPGLEDTAEVLVTTPGRSVPLWVILDAQSNGEDSRMISSPYGDEQLLSIAVRARSSDPCVALTVIDLTGSAVVDSLLCTPSKCEISSSVTVSSCHQVVGEGADAWAKRAPGGCDARRVVKPPDAGAVAFIDAEVTPPAESVADAGAVPHTSDFAARAVRSESQSGCACTLGSREAGASSTPGFSLAVGALELFRRGRRRARAR